MSARKDTHGLPATPRPHLAEREPYDPGLPILTELEAELEAELRALFTAPASREPKRRWPHPVRVGRRALVLVALVSLVGASALAGRSLLGDRHRANSGPALLASGGRGSERWQLQAYLYEGSVCYALFVANTVSSACGAPPSTSAHVSSILSPSRRFVVGLAGADVMRLRVRIGARTLLLTTHPASQAMSAHPAPQSTSAHPGAIPGAIRWFVASLSDPAARTAPALLTPLDGAGRALGAPLLDCDVGGASALCQNAAAKLAATPH